jgi:hypothetical protein
MTAQEFIDYLIGEDRLDAVMNAMGRLGFGAEFVAANVLSAGKEVTVSHVAMLWQGMPNKHDRKRTAQLFDLLSDAGLLEPAGDDETWRVKP